MTYPIHAATFILFCVIRNPSWAVRPGMFRYLGTLFNRHVLKPTVQAVQDALQRTRARRAGMDKGRRSEGRSGQLRRAAGPSGDLAGGTTYNEPH